MSIWCHINGSMRLDKLIIGLTAPEKEFHTWSFMDDHEKIEKCNVPYGSEGSLTISKTSVYANKNQEFDTYSFSGDLRDYSRKDMNEILKKWMNSLVPETDSMTFIRQAIFQVEFEDYGTEVYIWDDDNREFMRIYKNRNKDF